MNPRQQLMRVARRCLASARLWKKQDKGYSESQISQLVWEALKLRWLAQQIPSFALDMSMVRELLTPREQIAEWTEVELLRFMNTVLRSSSGQAEVEIAKAEKKVEYYRQYNGELEQELAATRRELKARTGLKNSENSTLNDVWKLKSELLDQRIQRMRSAIFIACQQSPSTRRAMGPMLGEDEILRAEHEKEVRKARLDVEHNPTGDIIHNIREACSRVYKLSASSFEPSPETMEFVNEIIRFLPDDRD